MTRDEARERLARVTERISAAAERAGRSLEDVEILPVTKGHSADAIRLVRELGAGRVGENRVAEVGAKRSELGATPGLAWHLIGRLQRNKARRALKLFDVIESVDSVRLAETLNRIVTEEEREPARVLVQVNPSGESAKAGFSLEGGVAAIARIDELPGLRVEGLMTMAPFRSREADLRRVFGSTARLAERCRAEISGFTGRALSMGMSDDFETAVEEGSTRVRLGTVLLGER